MVTLDNGNTVTLTNVSRGDIAVSNIQTRDNGTEFADIAGQEPDATTTNVTEGQSALTQHDNSPSTNAILAVSGLLTLGVVSVGVAAYRHYVQKHAMKEEVKNRIQVGYERAIDRYLKQHPDKTRYTLTEEDYKNISGLKETQESILKQAQIPDIQHKFSYGASIGWAIAGALLAVGVVTFATLFTLGTGGLGLTVMIGGGLVGAFLLGGILKEAGANVAKKQTQDFVKKQIDNSENIRGITPQQQLEQEREVQLFSNQNLAQSKSNNIIPFPDSHQDVPSSYVMHDRVSDRKPGVFIQK